MKHCPLPYFNERIIPSPFNKGEKEQKPSPLNKGGIEGGCAAISMLILHSFASPDFIASCRKHQVSAHYFIDYDGEITQMVEEQNRAWHAGLGSWREFESDLNSRSIGIEVKNETLGQSPFNEAQIKALIKLCQSIIKRYQIKPENIVGHSDIAPTRKADPGRLFPWKTLAENGVGLYPSSPSLQEGRVGVGSDTKTLLSSIGYNTENLKAAAYAFCRHFLPEYVNTDLNIKHLVDNVLNTDFSFMKQEKFLQTLKAVAYEFASRSKKP